MLAQVFNTTVDSIMALNPGITPTNLQIGQVITINPGDTFHPIDTPNASDQAVSAMLAELVNYMRMLWEQHIAWTRIVVMEILNDIPELEAATQRLLRNPSDFAEALRPFYGDEVASALEGLMTEHITIAAELVQAAKAGNNEAAAEIEQRWYENADQIAALLGSINPYWTTEDWSAMLYEHLDLLKASIGNMVAENYMESINGYDAMEQQALEMADMMAEGIYMQFAQ
jgi:hypothetical protein